MNNFTQVTYIRAPLSTPYTPLDRQSVIGTLQYFVFVRPVHPYPIIRAYLEYSRHVRQHNSLKRDRYCVIIAYMVIQPILALDPDGTIIPSSLLHSYRLALIK